MSTQYNNAGRTLVVDEVIEVKGTKKDAVGRFKQELDAQLLKRDTSLIRAQIGVIASDSHITPQEKQILKRELQVIISNYGLVASAEEYGHLIRPITLSRLLMLHSAICADSLI